MAINVLRGRARAILPGASTAPEPLVIGEPDREIFGCPVCSRPLAVGARRCPGCRTRLAMGVPLRRVSVFVALGITGTIALVLSAVTLFSVLQTVTARGATPPLPSVAPTAPASSPPGGRPVAPAPAIARTGLDQAVAINARLAAAGPLLNAAVGRTDLDSVAVAGILRRMASDATFGSDLVARIGSWSAAQGVAGELRDLYGSVRTAARSGLSASMTNDRAYRSAAQRMLTVLRLVAPADASIRVLATDTGLELPSLPAQAMPSPTE